MIEQFRLSESDRQTPVFRKLHAHLVQRLADKRRANDTPLDAERTALLRGEIKTLKYVTEEILKPIAPHAPASGIAAGES